MYNNLTAILFPYGNYHIISEMKLWHHSGIGSRQVYLFAKT